jgi:FMN phosphatase YigB (HAD superfamily)
LSNAVSRELYVLGNGIAEGVEQTATQTWDNIRDEAYRFVDAPLATTGDYLKRHAGDFVTGAAIAMIAPKGAAAKLLALWSVRGAGVATIEAVVNAGNPSADLDKVAHLYGQNLAHEGTNFLSSMPMAVCGAMSGRSAANAFLGRGNVVPDLITGKVTMADLRRNSSDLMDSIAPKRTKVLLTDLDDTLFPLQEYLIPMLKKNAGMLGQKLGIGDLEALRALGPERLHPWILEESPLAKQWKGTPAEFTRDVVEPFWRNDAEALAKCKPYETVLETLKAAKEQGVKVVVQTNAPLPWAIRRLTQIGLDGYVDRLYAIETPKPTPSKLVSPQALQHGQMLLDNALDLPHQIKDIRTLPPDMRKPDLGALQRVIAELGVKPREILAIGDNLKGDGTAPRHFGMPYVWAEYGNRIDPQLIRFLAQSKEPAAGTAAPAAHPEGGIKPQPLGVARQFSDVLDYFDRRPSTRRLFEQISPDVRFRTVVLPMTAYNLIPTFNLDKPKAASSEKQAQ